MVALVHEGEDRHAALSANFEQLPCLRLDAFARVDHHHHGIHRRQHAIRVLGEILVAGGVEQVDAIPAIL